MELRLRAIEQWPKAHGLNPDLKNLHQGLSQDLPSTVSIVWNTKHLKKREKKTVFVTSFLTFLVKFP